MKKLQLYVDPDKEKDIYQLIEQLEEEGKTGYKTVTIDGEQIQQRVVKRGYVQERIKDILKAYIVLSNSAGTTDPVKVLSSYMNNNRSSDKSEGHKNDTKPENAQSDLFKGFLNSGQNGFGLDE